MQYEIFLLIAAILLIFIDITVFSRKVSSKYFTYYGFIAVATAFLLILSSYLLLLTAFVNNDFSFAGVYSFSSSSLPLLSKIYASWAGAGGSMLLLTIILSTFYFGLKIALLKSNDQFKMLTCQVMGFVVIIFALVCLLRNPFERLSVAAIEGFGLNPQLQSVWMAIHPPIVFSAYAFVVLAFAVTIASLKTSRDIETSKLFKISTYASWMLLTVGIALGGVWAYEVLGWGGYWAWDPVETASLLPWLILTGYFIVKSISKNLSLTRETLIMLTFASLVFLSALTRGGLTQSVHSYAASAIGPIMLLFAVGMMGYFFYLAKSKRKSFFKLEVDRKSLTSRSSFVGFWSLIFISIVCLVGLAVPDFAYSYWTYPFVLLFVISLVGFSLNDKLHYARQFIIVTIALVAGVILTLLGFASVNVLVTLTVPLMVITLGALLYKLATSIKQRKLLWQYLFGIAVVVLLLGVFVSSGAKTSTTLQNVNVNSPVTASDLKVTLSNLQVSNSTTRVYNTQVEGIFPEYSIVTADVSVQGAGLNYNGNLQAAFYPNYGLVINPLIISTTTGDIYIHFEYTESLYNSLTQSLMGQNVVPDNLALTIQNNPLIYLVWAGVVLMLLALTAEFILEKKQKISP